MSAPLPLPANPAANPIRAYPLIAATLAAVAPTLLAYNLPPSSTVLNQCLAAALWGGWVLVTRPSSALRTIQVLLAALLTVAAAVLISWLGGSLPAAMSVSALALLFAAGVLIWAGNSAATQPDGPALFAAFAAALLIAGLASSVVALIQVFAPDWADGNFIAHSGIVGRAVGNLRQPNHLCSLLLWATIATVALMELGHLARGWAFTAVCLLVFAVELSASRTGAAGLLLLVLWGALDKRLSSSGRLLLLVTPILYGLSYVGAQAWGDWHQQAVGAGARIAVESAGAESPNSRLRIWANAITLIHQQPWTGVGFGEFNAAWSLTPFPGRPTAFFDHTHNLLIQLVVELGVPLATLVMVLMSWALWQGWRRSRAQAVPAAALAGTAAWMIVALILVHSLVEYPLWYSYFLLPASLAWGFTLRGESDPSVTHALENNAAQRRQIGLLFGAVLVAGGAAAMLDYLRVVAIYAPNENSAPLAQRISSGQRSVFFAQHADYAAATVSEAIPGRALGFRRATHYLLDTRLMVAWAEYLAQHGEIDKARSLAERLREFRNSDSEAYFATCANNSKAYQCQSPQANAPTWREYFKGP